MVNVKVGASVSEDLCLWRYMSIDKLIHLFEEETLFFTPLSYYAKSDPFEGYLPKVAFEALSSIFGESYKEIEVVYQQLKKLADDSRAEGKPNTIGDDLLQDLRSKLDSQSEFIKEAYKKLAKGITVNCWHSNQNESEAMWKLYSDNGKGIAIKTSLASIRKSIEAVPQKLLIQIGSVKYIDFHAKNISPKDCVIDGHLSPLLKRTSFSHENEVRLFTIPPITHQNLSEFEPKAELVKVNTKVLIEKIYISPFASEPFISSVKAISEKYGFSTELITESTLLNGHEELVSLLGDWQT